MNYGEIFSPILISSSLNPGPGVGGVPDSSPKQRGEEGSQEKRYLALTDGCQPVIKKERGTCKNFRSLRAQSWEV